MGWVQPNFPNGPQGGEQGPLHTRQPDIPFRPNTTIAHGFQSHGFFIPRSTRPTHQLPLIHKPNPNSTNRNLLGSKTSTAPRRLTDVELQSKIAKGLCFRCDKKFSLRHRCKNRELQLLVVQEDSTESEATLIMTRDEMLDEEIQEIAELSLNSLVGLSTPKTMKIRGMIGQREVIALIDCGATHNFISTNWCVT